MALDDLAPDATIAGRTAADVAAGLGELRRSVDGGDVAVDDVLATYGEMVDAVLDDGTARVQAITDSRLVARAQSFESLTRTVEAVALEQGHLTPVVARGAFDPESYDRLVGAAAVERQWRRRFEQSARPQEREVYDAALESPAVSVAERMLADALRAGPTGAVAGDADLWFTSSTRKVDVLSATVDRVAAGLTDTAESARAAASRREARFVALGVAALVLIVIQQVNGRPTDIGSHRVHG